MSLQTVLPSVVVMILYEIIDKQVNSNLNSVSTEPLLQFHIKSMYKIIEHISKLILILLCVILHKGVFTCCI